MQPNITEDKLKQIIDIARFAPSVHNTQPWKVQLQHGKIIVRLDTNHVLDDGDPTGRETIISLGIFAEAIKIAAKSLSYDIADLNLENTKLYVSLMPSSPSIDNLELLKKRASDRSIYKPTNISEDTLSKLSSLSDKNCKIWIITEKDKINEISLLTSKSIAVALSNPAFRHELSKYLVRPISKKKRGISVKSLYIPKILAWFQPEIVKFSFMNKKESLLEKKRWESSSAIIFISTSGDLHDNWFEAGRKYLQLSLVIEKLGLSQATSAGPVEASTFHEDVEQMLGTNQRIQAMLRIGKGTDKKYFSPRVSVSELIE